MTPSAKVSAATLAAAIGSLIIWLLERYGGVDMPQPAEAAIVVILTFVVGYFMPEVNPAPSAVATITERQRQHEKLTH